MRVKICVQRVQREQMVNAGNSFIARQGVEIEI
jgi:hypothetical protein